MTGGIIQQVFEIHFMYFYEHLQEDRSQDSKELFDKLIALREALIERIRKEFQCNYSYDGKCNALRQLIGDSA